MNKAEIQEAVAAAVAAEFAKQEHQPVICSLGLDKEGHAKAHLFIDSLMSMSEKLDRIKWGFLGGAVRSLGMVIIGLLCLGIIAWAKTELTKVGG